MFKKSIFQISLLLLITILPYNSTYSGGLFDDVIKNIVNTVRVPIHIDVWNHSAIPVEVVMDGGREEHLIASGHKATFDNANLGDMPTFHFHNPANGLRLGSQRVKQTGNSTIEWKSRLSNP